MKLLLVAALLTLATFSADGFLQSSKGRLLNGTDSRVLANVKIYSNLAEIIQPLSKLPIEFSAEDWANIRSDSVTLVGANVTVNQQTITEQKKSLNNVEVHVRSPSSSNAQTKFVKATMIDEKRNLVKLTDKDISSHPVYLTVSSSDIVYDQEPPQSRYYVNFTYDTSDAVYLSYLRSNLNWKTRYQLNLFEDAKSATLIAMADIRNDGTSKVEIEHAELLGGDINLQISQQQSYTPAYYSMERSFASSGPSGARDQSAAPTLSRGEEVAGLYVFGINKPFSIDAETNYLLPMFRPRVTVDRFASISKSFYGGASSSSGKARRSYRLVSDRYLSGGNCIIRESDRLAGETTLPDVAAKDKHEFSIGQDSDITYKENATLVSSRSFNEVNPLDAAHKLVRTRSVYDVKVVVKNFKKNRAVKVEYQQQFQGQSLKLTTPNAAFTQEGSTIKAALNLGADEEKSLSYNVEVVQ